jgi:hypothetical protein
MNTYFTNSTLGNRHPPQVPAAMRLPHRFHRLPAEPLPALLQDHHRLFLSVILPLG